MSNITYIADNKFYEIGTKAGFCFFSILGICLTFLILTLVGCELKRCQQIVIYDNLSICLPDNFKETTCDSLWKINWITLQTKFSVESGDSVRYANQFGCDFFYKSETDSSSIQMSSSTNENNSIDWIIADPKKYFQQGVTHYQAMISNYTADLIDFKVIEKQVIYLIKEPNFNLLYDSPIDLRIEIIRPNQKILISLWYVDEIEALKLFQSVK